MRRSLFLLVLSWLVAAGASAQTPEQLFLEGNAFYQQGKLEDALKRYETILDRGFVSGELFYNIGKCTIVPGGSPRRSSFTSVPGGGCRKMRICGITSRWPTC